eukprot:COSAG06_NODE_36079_length_452_cov_0.606232_1_plen_63_part_10
MEPRRVATNRGEEPRRRIGMALAVRPVAICRLPTERDAIDKAVVIHHVNRAASCCVEPSPRSR